MGDRNRFDARRMAQSRRHGMVPIASFLANISVKAGHCGAVSPIDAILHSVRANPGTCETTTIVKAALAIIDCWGAIHESEIAMLTDGSVALLGQFGNARLRLQYDERRLNEFASKLSACLNIDSHDEDRAGTNAERFKL